MTDRPRLPRALPSLKSASRDPPEFEIDHGPTPMTGSVWAQSLTKAGVVI